jgi:F-type H+-transporting ATPase subunit delta
MDTIKSRLQSALAAEPIVIPSVDERLIGGLVIQVGDTVYDGSLRTRLKNLRQRLREGYLNEIQSRRDRFSHSEGN